uniref:Uncharacterized protein n=1 Tax=Siphoviridae sp. ctTnV63 TaxID=2825523 RepID=A0A8S5NW45_9CAUD|nr:MAG TPA: hypothetical protein [Siphoviridae sp. ctTnV63]
MRRAEVSLSTQREDFGTLFLFWTELPRAYYIVEVPYLRSVARFRILKVKAISAYYTKLFPKPL